MATLKDNLAALQAVAKERTVKTQNIEYDLETLAKKIRRGLIKLDPDYQRRHRWGDDTSSKLIESLILNIPIPLIYLSQDVDVDLPEQEGVARYSVIDGQQRLTAITRYLDNELALTSLEILKPLNGTFHKDLPPFLVRRLEERTIRCLRIDSTVDPQVKYDIFERLNSGSVKLEPQELRNATYRGAFNEMLKSASEDEDFRVLLQVDPDSPEDSPKVKSMEDVELVLRFFALTNEGYRSIKKGFKTFLDEQMAAHGGMRADQIRKLRAEFLAVVRLARHTFGDTACAKYRFDDGTEVRMSRFNAAVFDALMVSLHAEVVAPGLTLRPDAAERFRKLFRNASFFADVSGSVNDAAKVQRRIDLARGAIRQ